MNPPIGRVLVIDDNEDVLTAIRLVLLNRVELVHTATAPAAVPTLLREHRYDAILLDMNFTRDASSGREGLQWLDRLLTLDPAVAVVMITAYGDVDLAVRAMKHGAIDFITKPWDNERLVTSVLTAIRLRRTREALGQPAPRFSEVDVRAHLEMVGSSEAMQRVFSIIEKVAATDANVLILGENGTGKELVARAVHRLSARAGRVFVGVDLGALPESLFESELFGSLKGAFTGAVEDRPGRFEGAGGGTLFLDEIGNISLSQQAKLLTALERREVVRVGAVRPTPIDIRLICATNQPLYERVARGRFRQDLLYRINTVEIQLPPLRERLEDLPLLAEHFLRTYADKYHRPVRRLAPAALARMERYPWPGNVRELQHTLERAVILSGGETIEPSDLSFSAPPVPDRAGGPPLETLDLEELERVVIRKALSKHGGNISRAADELGLTRKSLYRRIEKYGL